MEIDLNKYLEIYEKKKLLDLEFDRLYDNNNPDVIRKNILELLVEYGELANETKCFKYWSTKKMSEKEIVLEEYADCLLMSLFFCNLLQLDLEKRKIQVSERNIIEQFIYLYEISSLLLKDMTEERVIDILANLIYLGYLIGYNDNDLIEASLKKINKNYSRFSSGF